jgi:hypothetical protein
MCLHRKLAASALALFVSTVVVKYFIPNVICTFPWHPYSCDQLLQHGLYALPALPTLIAFALLILATVLPGKKA